MNQTHRTFEQRKHHYEIEKELASRLRNASKPERQKLYSEVYDELFRRVPDHPQLTRRATPAEIHRAVTNSLHFLQKYIRPSITFLEIGPGDCTLAFEVAKRVKQVYAVDVSAEITKAAEVPANFQLFLSDGSSIPLLDGSVQVAYSNSLIEHLHPDDVQDHLKNILRVLEKGGVYVCITSNQLGGPHDISKYFDEYATGFHLKEYTITELACLFQEIGFSSIKSYTGTKGIYVSFPLFWMCLVEKILQNIPFKLGRKMARLGLVQKALNIRLVGKK